MKKILIIAAVIIVVIASLHVVFARKTSVNTTVSEEPLRELAEDYVLGQKNLPRAIKFMGMTRAVQKNKEFPGEEEFLEIYQKVAQNETWASRVMDIYDKRFSDEEVLFMLEYRRSDVYKKEMDLGMEINQELMQVLNEMADAIVDQYPDTPPTTQEESEAILEVASENFIQEIQNSELPVVVKVHAVWCGPCKILAPTFESLASEYEGTVKFATLDVDKEEGIAKKYDITSVPTILFIKNGELITRVATYSPR